MSSLQGLINRTLDEIGYVEKASNSNLDSKTGNKGLNNYTKYARDVNSAGLAGCQGQAWCATFAFWCEMKEFGVDTALSHFHMTRGSYCGYNVFSTKGAFPAGKRSRTPQLGCLVVFTFSHIGRVVDIQGNTITTVEGNTSANQYDRNGGMVAKKTYRINDPKIDCFLIIDYESSSSRNYLMKGDKGQDVKDMQTKLIACGYSCGTSGADGDFGSGTETALKKFQSDYGLGVDGKFGPASKKKLDEVYVAKTSQKFEKIKITTTSSSVKGIRVCGNKVPVCSEPGNANKIVGYLSDGNLLACDYRAWTNGSCFFHYADGWVDGKNLQGWVADNGRWWYLIGNGAWRYPKNQLYKIDNDTYYFDGDGWMLSNQWVKVNGKWYFTRSWGGILYNSFYDDGENIYYLKADGVMASAEWMQFDGKWYYFRDWGAAFRNEKFTDPKDGNIYYGHEDGSIASAEWIQLDGKWYYFRDWGAAFRNELFTDPKDGNIYYGDENGAMVHDEWKQVNGDWYYFRSWGAALNIGLWNDGENTYYFGTDCKMKTGWITVDGVTYFFRDWGAMLKHAWINTNGVWKYVDKNGVYVPSKDTTNQPDTSDESIIYTGKV